MKYVDILKECEEDRDFDKNTRKTTLLLLRPNFIEILT